MANEATTSRSLTFSKGLISESLTASGTSTVGGVDFVKQSQTVPTSATAINLGFLAGVTLGEFIINNNDSTNFVDILTSTAGTTILHILPLNSASGYFASNITAPAARANTAAVQVEYMILPI
jgi:hypothetical protein